MLRKKVAFFSVCIMISIPVLAADIGISSPYISFVTSCMNKEDISDSLIAAPEFVQKFIDGAKNGSAPHQVFLGSFYHEGLLGLPKDDKQALFWFQRAADQGNAAGQYNVGDSYYNGYGDLSKDLSKAAELFQLAANQGHSAAQGTLAEMYIRGVGGLPKDIERGKYWMRKSADQLNLISLDRLHQLESNSD
jgi:TPR repeat protein